MRKAFWLCGLAWLAMSPAHAREFPGEFLFASRLSAGVAQVRDELTSERQRINATTTGFGFTVGYMAPFHVVAEVGGQLQNDTPIFGDNSLFSLGELHAQVGIDIQLLQDWHLVPKFGRVYWNLRPNVDELGPSHILPAVMVSSVAARSGIADVYELALRKQVAEQAAIGFSLRDFKLPDGHSRTLGLELVVRF